MSWRVVATVMIGVFVLVTLSATTAGPIHEVTDSIVQIDEDSGEGGQFDTASVANAGLRAFANLFNILIFGLIFWGAWYIWRRESTQGGL